MPRHFSADGSVSIDVPDTWVNQKNTRIVEQAQAAGDPNAWLLRQSYDGQIGPFAVDGSSDPYGVQATCWIRDMTRTSQPPLERLTREAFASAKEAEADGAPLDSIFVRDMREFTTESGLLGGATSVDHTWGRGVYSALTILVPLPSAREAMLMSMTLEPFSSGLFDEFVRVARTIRVHAP